MNFKSRLYWWKQKVKYVFWELTRRFNPINWWNAREYILDALDDMVDRFDDWFYNKFY